MDYEPEKINFPFIPIALRPRHDGWTAEKQIAFIEALAETGIVEEACRRVGMSDTSAYALRHRPDGAPFRQAWEAAMDYSIHLIEQDAFTRSRRGVARPIFHKGEQVGEWRHFDERLTMFLLRSRRPARFGKWMDEVPPAQPNLSDRNYALADALFDIAVKAPEKDGNRITDWTDEGDDECDDRADGGAEAAE